MHHKISRRQITANIKDDNMLAAQHAIKEELNLIQTAQLCVSKIIVKKDVKSKVVAYDGRLMAKI